MLSTFCVPLALCVRPHVIASIRDTQRPAGSLVAVSPTPAPTPSPNGTLGTCINGLSGIDGDNDAGSVCCPLECGQCGGAGCGTGGRNKECCINGVLNNQRDCPDSGAAPCVVTEIVIATPGPTVPTPAPAPIQVPADEYVGCFQDDRNIRILPSPNPISLTEMDAEFCRGLCDGFDYYGTQFARECWCGSGLPEDTYNQYGRLPDADCNMECTGDPSEFCGGRLVASVYAFNP